MESAAQICRFRLYFLKPSLAIQKEQNTKAVDPYQRLTSPRHGFQIAYRTRSPCVGSCPNTLDLTKSDSWIKRFQPQTSGLFPT